MGGWRFTAGRQPAGCVKPSEFKSAVWKPVSFFGLYGSGWAFQCRWQYIRYTFMWFGRLLLFQRFWFGPLGSCLGGSQQSSGPGCDSNAGQLVRRVSVLRLACSTTGWNDVIL